MSENKCKYVLLKVNFLIRALNPWKINGGPSQQLSLNAFFLVSPYRITAGYRKSLGNATKVVLSLSLPFPWLPLPSEKSLGKQFAKCDPWTSSIGLTQELLRNVESLALLQTSWIPNWNGWNGQQSVFNKPSRWFWSMLKFGYHRSMGMKKVVNAGPCKTPFLGPPAYRFIIKLLYQQLHSRIG